MSKLTPLMQQYWDIKSQHTDKVLLFRMGDFFEMFHQDAEVAAPILNIALTSRNKKAADETKMCGMPHHSIATPIAKLLAAGHKVAICDQIEDPRFAKGIVKRAVTRILSPGMVYDPESLDQLQANFLASYDSDHVSFLDVSSGQAFFYVVNNEEERQRLLSVLAPVELVLSSAIKQDLLRIEGAQILHLSSFDPELDRQNPLPESAQRLLAYARYMQGPEVVKSIATFEARRLKRHMEISPTSLRHLEVLRSSRGELQGSLFHAVKRTQTSAGARLLKQWLSFPLCEESEIELRLGRVEFWTQHLDELKVLRQVLSRMGDVERRIGKISNPNSDARDLLALSQALRCGLELSQYVDDSRLEPSSLDRALELVEQIERSIVSDPPFGVREGGMIRGGVNPDLDELITLTRDASGHLTELENREREATGISSLKVRFNNVFGYYIELTKTHQGKAPGHYQRKQTLANAERFTTPELQILEEKVLTAQSKRSELEFEIFARIKTAVLDRAVELLHLARLWSELDVLTGFAWLAVERNYKRPSFSKDGGLRIQNGRHAVVEQEVSQAFVPNSLSVDSAQCLLLTGPNMGGKSTLMRQVAVISLLAQAGSFVPAEAAQLPLFERIFTRIGASDSLSEGLSTFMVEMQESAEILKSADEKSLVILDEIGRGTSTYDGMSLAQAILEYLITRKKPITLFATHYHELTRLEAQFPQIHNAHMSIAEHQGEIRFLHTLKAGAAERSYGIHVGKLAGLPAAVTKRAQVLLEKLEAFQSGTGPQMSLLEAPEVESEVPELAPEVSALVEKLKTLPVQQMTPLEALNQLAQWQRSLS